MAEHTRLIEWMETQNKTQSDLARDLDVSVALISYIVNGQRVPTDGFKYRFGKKFDFGLAEFIFAPVPQETTK